MHCPAGLTGSQRGNGEISPADWRKLVTKTNGSFTSVKIYEVAAIEKIR